MDIAGLEHEALDALEKIKDVVALDAWHATYLGRKSRLNSFMRSIGEMPLEEKKAVAPQAQAVKKQLEDAYARREKYIAGSATTDSFDATVPAIKPVYGRLHPLTLVERDIRTIFSSMNFAVVEGPELETEQYNFDALNIPKNHPARDMQDTLWVSTEKGHLMRTHTSPMQVRHMEKHLPPFQIIVPGRVFRNEATDASHEINFYQFEGLMVGEGISLANLKGVITGFCERFFERAVEVRFRPSYFPFTEPSVEIDIKMENGTWLEVMGGGMVHPAVLEGVGYDPKKISGFAFGGGLDRFAMIKYGITDIRLFYGADLRFNNQF
jgi:phenylalanyl-tRNA synthetase alpha chain